MGTSTNHWRRAWTRLRTHATCLLSRSHFQKTPWTLRIKAIKRLSMSLWSKSTMLKKWPGAGDAVAVKVAEKAAERAVVRARTRVRARVEAVDLRRKAKAKAAVRRQRA